jgi:hypothetical protein
MEIDQTNSGDNQTIINNESGTVNINQNEKPQSLIGENSLHIYKEITNSEQQKFITGFVMACLIPAIGLVADFMQIHPALNLPLWSYLIVFFIIFLVIMIVYFDNYQILNSEKPKDNECRQLYSDKLFERTLDGYTIFTHSRTCLYPDCKGEIKIAPRPERYNGDYSFFGKCTLAGNQHSYGIDYNFKLYPIQVDWRVIARTTR